MKKEEDPEKVFKGRQSHYPIVYLDMDDGEHYPIPKPAGELILALRHDLARAQREMAKRKIKPLSLSSVSSIDLKVKDIKRVPLELRVYLD